MTTGDAWQRRVRDVADLVVWTASMRPPTLADGRLVCIDGPAGSGKSTLAAAVVDHAGALGSVALVHLDDLLDGWGGLPQVSATLERDVLTPLREGRTARYGRYDWHQERFGETCEVAPVDLLVVEGVGSGALSYASSVTTLVWVEAPAQLRLARGIERDGEALLPQWRRWMADEDALFVRERTRERADLLVDGTGEADAAVVLG
ncbi:uridine kinase family protein [Nocardioides pakistanensis]